MQSTSAAVEEANLPLDVTVEEPLTSPSPAQWDKHSKGGLAKVEPQWGSFWSGAVLPVVAVSDLLWKA